MLSLLTLLLLALKATISDAQDFTSNATGFSGTWTTGSGGVVTGPVSIHSTSPCF